MTRMTKISVVIPASYKDPQREENLKGLIADIRGQTLMPDEIIIVRGARPRTKAHNEGVAAASGDLIIFFDDDIRLGPTGIIQAIAQAFTANPKIGIVGVAIAVPKESSSFQQACAKQLLKAHNMVAHAALAIPKSLYEKVGGEDESLRINDDAQLNFKVMQAGLINVLLPPEYFVYHPEPATLLVLIKKSFAQGYSQAQDYKTAPAMIFSAPLSKNDSIEKSSISRQLIRNLKILGKALITLNWLLLISRVSTGLGFFCGHINKITPVSIKGKIEMIYH